MTEPDQKQAVEAVSALHRRTIDISGRLDDVQSHLVELSRLAGTGELSTAEVEELNALVSQLDAAEAQLNDLVVELSTSQGTGKDPSDSENDGDGIGEDETTLNTDESG